MIAFALRGDHLGVLKDGVILGLDKLGLGDAICLTDFFDARSLCEYFKRIRCESSSFNRIAAEKLHR